MNKKITTIFLVLSLTVFIFGMASAYESDFNVTEKSEIFEIIENGENYGI
jgi:hypothetical protein